MTEICCLSGREGGGAVYVYWKIGIRVGVIFAGISQIKRLIMNGITSFLLRCSMLIGVLFGTFSCRTSSLFIDNYNVSGVYRAEVSGFKENNYKPIESEKLIEAIKTSKQGLAKYNPDKEVMLYNAEGDSTKLVFSKDNKYFFINEIGYFELSNKNAKIVSELFEEADHNEIMKSIE